MTLKDDILTRLGAVPGPDGVTPLPRSGALSDIAITDGKAHVAIVIDPSRAAESEGMRRATEAALAGLPGLSAAFVTLTADRAPAAAPAAAPPRPAAQATAALAGIRHIVAVASGKGGVGKSTTAANLALALAASGLAVGLLDADIFGPSVPRLLGITTKPTLDDAKRMRPVEAFGLKVMSIGFMIAEDQAVVWRGPMVMSALRQLLTDVAWGTLDVLVVDMPPGTGDVQLSLAQTARLSGAVIVSTPQDLALIDARRGIAMFRRVDVPVLGIVENMSTFVCPHCGTASDIFGHGGARHDAERLGIPFLGEIPLHMTIRQTSDAGRPIVGTDPAGAQARPYHAIAASVRAALDGAQDAGPLIVVEN